MKYKVGDRVRIRTWEDMKKEYGLSRKGYRILTPGIQSFTYFINNFINENSPDRIFTIQEVHNYDTKAIDGYIYIMKEVKKGWITNYMIECLAKDIPIPIYSRFEILDL